MMNAVQKSLSNVALEIMKGNVDSFAMCYSTKSGQCVSIYDMTDDANVWELIGMIKVLNDRVVIGSVEIPELGQSDDGEE